MRRTWFWGAFLAAMILAGLTITQVAAQEKTPVTDYQVNALARQLYCPVCENTPLDVCPTTACAQWRALIREKMELGWSEVQIKEYFAAQYGDRVLSEPPRRGLNWLVYVLPPLLIGIAAIFLFFLIRKLRAPQSSASITPAAHDPSGDEFLAQIENEIQQRRKQ
jgi:cytochrome c-type biogenesis protein CcmH